MSVAYYVYALAFPDGQIFYVGKGTGRRISDHGTTRGRLAKVNAIIAQIADAGGVVIRTITHAGLSEAEAFDIERQEIARIGRAPLGPLVNQNDGGWGGRNPSPSTREKIRRARHHQKNPSREHMVFMNAQRGPWTEDQRKRVARALTGRDVSPETGRKISEAGAGKRNCFTSQAARNARALWSLSEEGREALREAGRHQVHSEERRAEQSARQKGKAQDPMVNAKRSASLKGRVKTPEHLAAIAAAKAARYGRT